MNLLHTSGSWQLDDRCPGTIRCDDSARSKVADTDLNQAFISNEQKAANARLIAAAPEMIKALIRMLPYLDNMPEFQQKEVINTILKAAPELRGYLEQRQLIAA